MEAMRWVKSSRSGAAGHCVEVARVGDEYLLRNSRDPQGPRLSFTPQEWQAFLDGASDGEFRDL